MDIASLLVLSRLWYQFHETGQQIRNYIIQKNTAWRSELTQKRSQVTQLLTVEVFIKERFSFGHKFSQKEEETTMLYDSEQCILYIYIFSLNNNNCTVGME